ncbi:MAG: hypothetical protein QM757_26820 [Paludibaculum sp.]
MIETKSVSSVSERIPVHLVRTDGGTQPRAAIVESEVAKYAEMMESGIDMDPVLVYFDGSVYWLADGFHRLAAARRANFDLIAAEVRQGTQQDAQWASYSANAKHGIPRTNEDKRRAVVAAFGHVKSAGMSDRAIAGHCGVSNRFVGLIREEIPNCERFTVEKRTGLDGKSRKMPARKTQAPAPAPRYPVPNRFGVFTEDAAIEVPHEHDGAKLSLSVLRIGDDSWIYTFSANFGPAGRNGALNTDCLPEPNYAAAIGAAATEAADYLRDLRASSATSNRTRRQIGPVLAWLCTMGAPPDVMESGPVEEPAVEEAHRGAATPEPGTAIWRNMQEIRQARASIAQERGALSPDAVELQRAISFLNQPLDWQRLAAELGRSNPHLSDQALKGRDVLDGMGRRGSKQLKSA